MPYITKMQRAAIDEVLMPSDGPGGLNYAITRQIKRYIDNQPLNYQRINDVIGALEGAKLEFYRRIAAPYEDTKMAENGDVYE